MTIEYDYSVEKIDKDGNKVLSNRLEEGEKLANGQSYADEVKRLDVEPQSSPFAQGTMIEHNKPENPSEALTLSADGINTKRETDADPETFKPAPFEPELTATQSEDGNSTAVVPTSESTTSGAEADDADEAPKESDSKQVWYDYATEHKGLTVAYEDITKNEIIAYVSEH
jgi:hypothetical protein